MTVCIHFDGRKVNVEAGSHQTVLELAREAGRHIEAKCGGVGSCARCSVLLGEGRYRVFSEELEVTAEQRREVLACQAVVLSEHAEVFIPDSSAVALDGARIVHEMRLPEYTFNPCISEGYGMAVDIGTTTMVAALLDLSSGEVLGIESLYNQQILKADDVVSRISLCAKEGELEAMQELVIMHSLNPLIYKLCARAGIETDRIVRVAVSGNTVMTHIFFGISPVSIGVLPFVPLSRTFQDTTSRLGIDANPTAIVEAVPAISGFLGGDIVSDMHVSSLSRRNGLVLLTDIGTNGEMVACFEEEMTACATAAGPAFEGAGLLHGARAAKGAIDAVRFDGQLEFEISVIGDAAPMGLCGSAIIDFIANGFRCGLISAMGRYDIAMLKAKGRYEKVAGMHACTLVDADHSATGESITVTEHDIAEILKAKAAIYGGFKSLLAELKKTVHDIDQVVLAGGFANYINIENAVTIGLLPDIGIEKYTVIGNGSLAGAVLALLDQDSRESYRELMNLPRVIALNLTNHFGNHFQEALAIPNLETSDFPGFAGHEA